MIHLCSASATGDFTCARSRRDTANAVAAHLSALTHLSSASPSLPLRSFPVRSRKYVMFDPRTLNCNLGAYGYLISMLARSPAMGFECEGARYERANAQKLHTSYLLLERSRLRLDSDRAQLHENPQICCFVVLVAPVATNSNLTCRWAIPSTFFLALFCSYKRAHLIDFSHLSQLSVARASSTDSWRL